MQIETVPIDSIHSDPANLRLHPERNLAGIKGSLTRFGQQRPIVVDGRGIIVAGNGTHAAAKALGWTTIQIVRTALGGSELVAYGIADNRTAEMAQWDQPALAEVLTALQAEDADLTTAAGYTPDELAALLGANNSVSAAEAPADFPAVDENIETEHQCPKCGYVWSGSTAPAGSE